MSLTNFMFQQNWLQIISVIYRLGRPCSLRELVDITGQSPAGVKDVLSRLKENEILEASAKGNKILYKAILSPSEEKMLRLLIKDDIEERIKKNSKALSKRAKESILWIDETTQMLKEAKRNVSAKNI